MEGNELDDAYPRWGGEINRRCLDLLGDAAAAEDATQDVFERLMRHADRLLEAVPIIYLPPRRIMKQSSN